MLWQRFQAMLPQIAQGATLSISQRLHENTETHQLNLLQHAHSKVIRSKAPLSSSGWVDELMVEGSAYEQ